MNTRRNALHGGLLIAGVLAALSGCAVMRIDVDVYKGPLADEKHVQTEQFAAMAMGAKPLLIELRDRLQWSNDVLRACARQQTTPVPYNPNYASHPPEIVQKTNDTQNTKCEDVKKGHWNERAERVNGVLSLYLDKETVRAEEDPQNEALRNLIDRGIDAWEEYEELNKVFDPPKSGVRADDWKRFSSEFNTDATVLLKKYEEILEPDWMDPKVPSRLPSVEGLNFAFNEYLDAVFGPESREVIVQPLDGPPLEPESVQRVPDIRERLNDLMDGETLDAEMGRVREYWLLRDGTIVRAHATLLFGTDDSPAAQAFVARVREKANAYFAMRDVLQRLWNLAIESLNLIHTQSLGSPERRSEYLVIAAQWISALSQPEHIAAAINPPVSEFGDDGLSKLKELLVGSGSGNWVPPDPSEPIPKSLWDFGKVNESVQLAVKKQPKVMADLLLNADAIIRRFAGKQIAEIRSGAKDKPDILARHAPLLELSRYGLTRGPSSELGTLASAMDPVIDSLQKIRARATAGLDRGRLDDGIEKLIENYLKKAHAAAGKEETDAVKEARAQLSDALVRFSKKVLMIADNDKLLVKSGESSKKELDRYILVLQAVGNSIRIQADELRQREEYEKKLKGREPGERMALALALSRTTGKTLRAYISALRDRLTEGEAKLETAQETFEKADRVEIYAAEAVSGKTVDRTASGTSADDFEKLRHEIDIQMRIRDALKVFSGTAPALKSDQADIKQRVDAAEKTPNLSAIDQADKARNDVVNWLKGQVIPGAPTVDRLVLLKNAIPFWEGLGDAEVTNILLSSGATLHDKMASYLAIRDNRAAAELETLKDEASQKKTAAATERDTASAERRRLATILRVVTEREVEILLEARQSAAKTNAGAVVKQAILTVLEKARELAEEKKEKAKNKGDQEAAEEADKLAKDLIEAKKEIEKIELPAELRLDLTAERPDAREVLDDMIALLRYQHIEAVRTSGADSTMATQLGEALAVAYEQRAGMAYIRPSSSYLRSSYPATSLQDDPRLNWTNMLNQHALRTTPILGHFYNRIQTEKDKVEINREIDKQFWQNINSVRVAGAGRTNYVLAKDDIGNWYVKKYSADSEPIIRSAKSLALFGMGGQFDPDLAAQALTEQGLDSNALRNLQQPVTPALLPAFEQRRDVYAKSTGDLYDALRTLLDDPKTSALRNSIERSWVNNPPTKEFAGELTSVLDVAVDEVLQPVITELGDINLEEDKDGAKRAQWVLDALKRIQRFRETLKAKVLNIKLLETAKNELKNAQDEKKKADATLKAAEDALTKAKSELEESSEVPKELIKAVDDNKAAVTKAAAAVKTANEKVKKAELAEKAAISDVNQIVRDFLAERIEKRLRALTSYEEGVVVLGSIKTEPDSESANSASPTSLSPAP